MSITAEKQATRTLWLRDRQGSFGASDTASILGLPDAHGSPMSVYLSKVGELIDNEPDEAMAWGLQLEDDIVDAYQERTGRKIIQTQVRVVHPEYEFMAATIDGITECGRLVEFKSVGLYGHGESLGPEGDTESLPDSWVVQTNQGIECGMAAGVVTRDEGDVAAFGPGLRLRVYPVRRNEALIRMVIDALEAFWTNHVIPGIPPDEIAPEDAAALTRAFRRQDGGWLTLGADIAEAAYRYKALGEEIGGLQRERDVAKARILLALGNNGGGETPDGWEVERKVVTVRHKARDAYEDQQVRIYVKENKG